MKNILNILGAGTMSLVDAAYNGDLKKVINLLKSKCNINEIHNGKTALHWGAQYAECNDYPFEILKLLSDLDADVNIRDNDGHTALYYAAGSGWLSVVELLAPKTDYEGLKKAHDIAQRYYHAERRYDRICKALKIEINSRPDHQQILNQDKERKELLNQKQRERYLPCIESSYDLYEKHISPLYDKDLTITKLEETVKKLTTEENRKILARFRAECQGNKDFLKNAEQLTHEKRKKLNDEIKKYDYEIIPTYHIIKYLESKKEIFKSIRFSCNLEYDSLLSLDNLNSEKSN